MVTPEIYLKLKTVSVINYIKQYLSMPYFLPWHFFLSFAHIRIFYIGRTTYYITRLSIGGEVVIQMSSIKSLAYKTLNTIEHKIMPLLKHLFKIVSKKLSQKFRQWSLSYRVLVYTFWIPKPKNIPSNLNLRVLVKTSITTLTLIPIWLDPTKLDST